MTVVTLQTCYCMMHNDKKLYYSCYNSQNLMLLINYRDHALYTWTPQMDSFKWFVPRVCNDNHAVLCP